MMNTNKTFFKTLAVLLLLFITASCSSSKKDQIVIGSKNFTEQVILGEILSILLEEKTDLKIVKKLNLGGTFVCFTALKNGDIDIYAEYTGTGLVAILKKELIPDKETTYQTVKDEFKSKYNLQWLKPLGFNNTYTLTMREKQAKKLSIKKISDLKKYEGMLQAGFNHEFMERDDGYKGLSKKYNLRFKKEAKELDSGLMYKAVKEKEVDVICGFATDGRIAAFNLVMLKDDKNFFPPYYAAPLVSMEISKKYPVIESALNKLGGLITDEEMRRMNYEVDQKGLKEETVARNFLVTKGLIDKKL